MHVVPETTQGVPPRTFSLPLRVYYEDTDAAGVVYYANYFRFCERARTELLRSTGFDNASLRAERNLVFVVRSVNADYLAPAMLDDMLRVDTHIARVGGASLEFTQKISRGDRPLFDARILIACVDVIRGRAAPLPTDIRQQLQPFLCQ